MSKKGVTNILKSVGFVAGATVTVTGLGLCGYALADGAVKLPSTATEIITPTPPQDVSTVVTDETITIVSIANAEYSLDGIVWQDSNIFLDLQPAQEYTVYIRIKATADTPASEPTQVNVTTDKSIQQVPQVTTPEATANSIIFEHIVGVEYSINNGVDWQTENIFSNLSPAQEYTILVRYKETDTQYASEPFTVQISTLKDTQEAPNITEAETTSPNSITMPIVENVEYSLNNETWQDNNVFNDLTPGQAYTIYIRYKETATQYASPAISIEVTLDKLSQDAPQVTQAESFTSDSITMPLIVGAEYSINNGIDWQDENVFGDLEPKTEYTIYVRLAETATQYASAITQVTVITDSAAGLYDTSTGQRTMSWQDLIDDNIITVNNGTLTNISNKSLQHKLIVDDSVTAIGDYAFQSCAELTEIVLPNTINSIGDYAFYFCSNLKSVAIPEGVQEIKQGTFSSCDNLEYLYLPASVTIANYAIPTGNNLVLELNEQNPNYTLENNILYNKNKTIIIRCPYSPTSNIVLPSTVTSIAISAFKGCTNLNSITLSNNLTSIPENAFASSSLESINIPDNITSIGNSAFNYCVNLEEVVMPNTITFIGNYAFTGCSSLTNLIIPGSVKTFGSDTFSEAGLESVIIEEGVTSLNFNMFSACVNLTSVTLPNTLISIESGVFNTCKSLENIVLPASLTGLSGLAFSNCTSLQTITLQSITPPTLFPTVSTPDNVIYKVPMSSVEAYKTANVWSNYADKIVGYE